MPEITEPTRVGAWHVYFGGKPDVAGHMCEWHHSIGQSFRCKEDDEHGNCSHVQTRPCDCTPRPDCDGCLP